MLNEDIKVGDLIKIKNALDHKNDIFLIYKIEDPKFISKHSGKLMFYKLFFNNKERYSHLYYDEIIKIV